MEILIGQSLINGPFPIAMFDYQRVVLQDCNQHGGGFMPTKARSARSSDEQSALALVGCEPAAGQQIVDMIWAYLGKLEQFTNLN